MSARVNFEGGKPPLRVFLELFLGWDSLEILEQPCTEDKSQNLLVFVSKNTSLSLHDLGRSLDLSKREVSDIHRQFVNYDQVGQKYQVLMEWINKTGHEATYHRLILVLYDNDDFSTTEMACRMIRSKEDSRTAPFHPNVLRNVVWSCSPYVKRSLPDARKCTLHSRPDYTYVNFVAHVTLAIKDQNGKSVPSKVSDVTASLRCILSDSITDCRVSGDLLYQLRGMFRISYTAENRGRFELHVKVNGEGIQDSPFAIFAKVAPKSLGKPVKIIRGVKQPTSVAIGPNSELVVVEMSASRVTIFNNFGNKIKTLETDDASTRLFLAPSGVSLDGSGNIYVVDQQKITKISPMGKLMITSPYPQGGLSSLEMPSSISFAPNSNLHVCSPSSNEIIILDTELKPNAMTRDSSKSGNFLHPQNVAFDTKREHIRSFIADQGNHKVQVLDDQSGNHLFEIKSATNQKPWIPCGIFVDPRTDLVYVTDLGNHQVSIFCSSGEHVHSFGCEGKGPGEFSSPTGIAVDLDGFVYVCDSSNDCVQVF